MSRLAEYYNSGSYHGISSATVLYELLISKLNRADNESLWCVFVWVLLGSAVAWRSCVDTGGNVRVLV